MPAFRGAVIKKVGHENVAFHQHLSDNKFLYRYPLIQYKQINRKAAIMCINYGVDEIHKFFEQTNRDLPVSGRVLDMSIDHLRMNNYTIRIAEQKTTYKLRNWIALNQANYIEYNRLTGVAEKALFLENLLKANILSFAKGIEWTVENPIEAKIQEITSSHTVTLKKQKVNAFDLLFTTNVFLPNYIGLGKSVSLGFGMVKMMN